MMLRRIRKMAEKTSQKKVVGRTVAIVLGMVCIVLLAGLVGAIAVYTPMINNSESQIAEKNSTISSLNSTISSLNSQISALNNSLKQSSGDISAKDSQIAALNLQVARLISILNLNVSEVLVYNQFISQDASANTSCWNDVVNFAGYVSVSVQSSTNTTYVEVVYSSYGVNYDGNVTVGTSGTAVFPILPALIDIRVGNTNPVDPANATVTAIYYY
jgi:predicted PurR-regulated permease PerM